MTRRLILPLLAAAALALPAAAAAHDGWHWHHHRTALFAKLSGTGTSFAGSGATAKGTLASDLLGTGTFAASIATNWTAATTRTGDRGTLRCAPATATLTLTGSTTADNASASLTGTTCTFAPAGATTTAAAMFFGRAAGLVAAGSLAGLNGTAAKAFLRQGADGTVRGAVLAGFSMLPLFRTFAVREHDAARHTGGCDGR